MAKYKRKKETKYSLADLIEAVENVRQKRMNSYEASIKYEIPRSTIIHRFYGTRGAKQPTPGRPLELSKEWETKVASYLHEMEKCGYPLTPKEVKLLISDYIRRNGIITRFKDDYPGKEWFRGFKRRHKLSLKKPQAVEVARKQACNPFTVYNYFGLLEQATQELGLIEKPHLIYNLDETSFCSDPIKTKVVGRMGFPSIRTTGAPGRNNTSVLFATNALGKKIPPLIIFQGKHLWTEWFYKNEDINTAYAVSRKGWMETTIFEKFIKDVFLPAVGAERPILLVYDGHSTHVELSVIELLKANQITVLKLPAHSSHILQPLDCSTMKPMKDKWDSELVKWQRLHMGAKLPKPEFAKIITMLWDNLNPVIIENGFRKTGIYPLNRDAIQKEKFDNLSWARWEEHLRLQNEQSFNDTDHNIEENLGYTQKDNVLSLEENNSTKENKVPMLMSMCLKNFNREVRLSEMNNNTANIAQDMKENNIPKQTENDAKASTNTSKTINLPMRKGTRISFLKLETVKDPKSFVLSLPKNTNTNDNGVKILDNVLINSTGNKSNEVERVSFEDLLLKTIGRNELPTNSRKRISHGAEILTYKDALDRLKKEKEEKEKEKETKRLNKLKKASNNKNKKQQKKSQRKQTKPIKNKRSKKLKSDSESDCSYTSINSSEHEDIAVYRQRFLQESLDEDLQEPLPSTSRGQDERIHKIKRERVNKKEKKEKPKLEEIKGLNNQKRASVIKNKKSQKKPQRKQTKPIKNKRGKKLESDSESDCSYTSINSSEHEDLAVYRQRVLQESIDEDLQEPLQSTARGQDEKKVDSSDSDEPTSIIQNGVLPRTTKRVINERKKYTDGEQLATLYRQEEKKVPLSPGIKKTLNVGDFILAKFRSTKGKRTYKYVCLIEDINQGKYVVKGLKCKKNNKEFRFVENDISIIEKEDVISSLPNAVLNEQRDTVIFPYKVEIFECK